MPCSVESSTEHVFEAGEDGADEGYIFIWREEAEIRSSLYLKMLWKCLTVRLCLLQSGVSGRGRLMLSKVSNRL